MSRSDTFRPDLEPTKSNESVSKSSTWISAPILQNTTCEALLDPRKLLCESSSIVALIPCHKTSPKTIVNEKITESPKKECDAAEVEFNESDELCLNLLQGTLLNEILSSVSSLDFENESNDDLRVENSNIEPLENPVDAPELLNEPNVVQDSEVSDVSNRTISVEPEAITSVIESIQAFDNENSNSVWGNQNDDGFKDVIDAINRLCDTMSSSTSNSFLLDSTNTYQNDQLENDIQKSEFNVLTLDSTNCLDTMSNQTTNPFDPNFVSCNRAEAIYFDNPNISYEDSPETNDEVFSSAKAVSQTSICNMVPDAVGESSENFESLSSTENLSASLADDNFMTNQADVLQCSSIENSDLYLSSEAQSPKPEEAPAPGHVAAMRMRFETITNVNISTMRLLKKNDSEM